MIIPITIPLIIFGLFLFRWYEDGISMSKKIENFIREEVKKLKNPNDKSSDNKSEKTFFQ